MTSLNADVLRALAAVARRLQRQDMHVVQQACLLERLRILAAHVDDPDFDPRSV